MCGTLFIIYDFLQVSLLFFLCQLKTKLPLMTTKSMVESAGTEDMGQLFYHLDPDTRKIARRLEKMK